MNRPTPSHPLFALAMASLLVAPTAYAQQRGPQPMEELVAEALRGNPEIQAARREREAAQQRIRPAGALDDPMLEVGLINVPTNPLRLDREDMTMKMIGLSQRLPYPGKLTLRQDVATRDAESVGFGYEETANRVVREVKAAYLDLALTRESTRLVESNKLVLEQFLRLAEARYAVGQGGQADVLKAQTQLSRMIDELIKLERERRMAEAELNRTLGRPAEAASPVPETLRLKTVQLAFEEIHESALRDRPQLRALKSMIARSEKALELARKDYYPDFDVRLSYGQRESMPDGTGRPDMVSLTLAMNLPIWRENKIQPRIAEAQAMRGQALDMYQAQRNELVMKLRQQIATAEQNLRSARLYDSEVLPQARLTVEASLAAYRVNRIDFLTLLDNQMTVFNYEIAYAANMASYNKAVAEIEFLTGSRRF